MGEVFPADDPVARWLVTMSIGLNDVLHSNGLMVQAEKDYEDLYYFRLASAHLWEVAKLITASYDSWPEIQAFVAELADPAHEHFEAIGTIATTGDVASIGTELVQVRDLFSHYQEMDEQGRENPRDPITKAMAALVDEEIELEIGEEVHELRLSYGDAVIAQTVMRLIPEEDMQKHVLGAFAEGVGHVAQFVQIALNARLEPRKDTLERIK